MATVPNLPYGSYQRYKSDSNVFLNWLSKTATACGYQAPGYSSASASERTTNKSRSKGEKSQKNSVDASLSNQVSQTSDLLKQAEVVVGSGQVRVPRGIIRILQRAIQVRKRCANWFRMLKVRDEESNNGHLHFIEVLTSILELLKTTSEANFDSPGRGNGKSSERAADSSIDELSNRYAGLTVEELQEVQGDDSANVQHVDMYVPPARNTAEIYDPYDDQNALLMFFEDLHAIEDFLQETWQKYKAGEIDLVTATMTTTAAVSIVRQEEKKLAESIPFLQTQSKGIYEKKPGYNPDEQGYIKLLNSLLYGVSGDEAKGGGINNDGPIFQYHISENATMATFFYMPDFITLTKFQSCLGDGVVTTTPRLISPFGKYLGSRAAKEEQDDEFLSHLLIDNSLEDLIQSQLFSDSDAFAMCYKNLKKGELHAWQVFISRIMIDLHEILGDKTQKEYESLGEVARTTSAGLHCTASVDKGYPIEDRESWPRDKDDESWRALDRLWLLCDELEKPPFPPVKQEKMVSFYQIMAERIKMLSRSESIEAKEELEGAQEPRIYPAENPAFLHVYNPLYCGIKKFELALRFEHLGTSLANHHRAIFIVAHLYNATRKLGLITKTWPELHRVIYLHRKAIFLGQLPTTISQIFQRYTVTQGYSARIFGSSNLHMNVRERRKRKGPRLSNNPTLENFYEFFEGKKTMDQCIYQFEFSDQATADQQSIAFSTQPGADQDQVPNEIGEVVTDIRNEQPQHDNHQSNMIEFLSEFRKQFPPHLHEIQNTQYIELTRICNDLLKRIRLTILVELNVKYAPPTSLRSGRAPSEGFEARALSGMAGGILKEAESCELDYGTGWLERAKQLQIVGDVMRGFLEKLEMVEWDLTKVKV